MMPWYGVQLCVRKQCACLLYTSKHDELGHAGSMGAAGLYHVGKMCIRDSLYSIGEKRDVLCQCIQNAGKQQRNNRCIQPRHLHSFQHGQPYKAVDVYKRQGLCGK